MKREQLIQLFDAAAQEAGYTFHSGEENSINGTVRSYPAAWLVPPAVRSHSGRREGETTWRTTLHLMALPSEGAALETMWRTLEGDALSIAARLGESSDVCTAAIVHCTPARQSLTVHGEISVALTCDVTMWYYI